MRYFNIKYEGELVMRIYANSARSAKERAKDTLAREGRNGRNLAKLVAE